MHPSGQLSALAASRAELRARIRAQREANACAAACVLRPLRWIELGVRVHRLVRRLATRANERPIASRALDPSS